MATQLKSKANQKALTGVPGTEPGAHMDAWWWLVVLVVVVATLLVTLKPDPFWRIVLFVRDGLYLTVWVTVVSFVLVLIVGMFGGLGRLSKNKFISWLSSLYVEMVRGVPLMVQLLWWYYAFPVIFQKFGTLLNWSWAQHYRANPILMAIAGLTFGYGAFMSEIYRAGIQSIPIGQMEAARSQGMTYLQAMRHVILPQAIRVIMPPVGNEFIALLKDSSLVSVVAVADLTRRGKEFMSTHFNPIESMSMVALLYLIMTLFAARVVTFIEKKTKLER